MATPTPPRMSKQLQEAVQQVMSIMLTEHNPHTQLILTSHRATLTEDAHSITSEQTPYEQSEDDMMFGVSQGG